MKNGKKISTILSGASAVALGSIVMCSPSHAQQAGAAQPADIGLQDIVVTAQRRSTNILETPVSVSVAGGEQLEQRQIRDIADLTSQMPGVQFGAQYTTTNVNIRGVGANAISTQGAEPGVALHLDGVYLGQTGLAANSFLDVDHIEVLRGPQGTLFGRNATGGAINIISARPTSTFQGDFGVGYSVDPTQWHVDGFASGPLNNEGTVLFRLSGRWDHSDGYTKNLAVSGPRRLDDEKRYALRGQLEFRPSEDLTARFVVDYAKRNDSGQAAFLLGAPGAIPDPNHPGQVLSITYTPAEVTAQAIAALNASGITVPGPVLTGTVANRQATDGESFRNGSFTGVRGEIEYRTAPGTFKLLAAYDKFDYNTLTDGDGSNVKFTRTYFLQKSDQRYAELLFTSEKVGPAHLVLGANVYRLNADEDCIVPIESFFTSVNLISEMTVKSYAVFGHADVDVTDQAHIFGGARYTKDSKDFLDSNNFVNAGVPKFLSKSWGELTYELGARYEFTPHFNIYAKYSTGFKSGGFSGGSLNPAYNPEKNSSWEAGLKGRMLDNRLEVSLSAYSMDYKDLQVNQVIGPSAVTRNAARAKIKGGEAEVVALVTPELRLEGTFSLVDGKFTQFITGDASRPLLGALNLSGHRVPGAPKYSYAVGAYYSPQLGDGKLTLGARYYWRDKIYFSEFNLDVASSRAVGRLDLTANYTTGDGNWTLGLFARNITNKKVISSVQVVSALLNSAALGRLDPSRDIGLSVRRRF